MLLSLESRHSNKILDSCNPGCGRQALWGTPNTIPFSQNNSKSSVFCCHLTRFHTRNLAHVKPISRIGRPAANGTSRTVSACFSVRSTTGKTFWSKPVWLAHSPTHRPDRTHRMTPVLLSSDVSARPPCWYRWQQNVSRSWCLQGHVFLFNYKWSVSVTLKTYTQGHSEEGIFFRRKFEEKPKRATQLVQFRETSHASERKLLCRGDKLRSQLPSGARSPQSNSFHASRLSRALPDRKSSSCCNNTTKSRRWGIQFLLTSFTTHSFIQFLLTSFKTHSFIQFLLTSFKTHSFILF